MLLPGLIPPLPPLRRAALRDPALLADYARAWLEFRRPAADEPPFAAGRPILSADVGLARVGERLGAVPPGPAHAALGDPAAAARAATAGTAFGAHGGDAALGELAYRVVRAVRPEAVIETGVASGVTSAYVLAALADNARGTLHSIDLPPRGMHRAGLLGTAVPIELCGRWRYHWRSASRALVPVLTATAGGRRVFIHDSLHTYAHMRWELDATWRHFGPGDVLLCDDVQFNGAFDDFAAACGGASLLVAQPDKGGITGILFR